jgi:glycine cleavage system protein P-like pyridoxal-binding family
MNVNLYELMYSSGAQGEYAGLRVIRAYHEHQGAPQRRVKKRK